MHRILKLLFKGVLSILLIIILIIQGFTRYEYFIGLSDKTLTKTFCQGINRCEHKIFSRNGFDIHYTDLGEKENPLLFFVHGAPGSRNDRKQVMKNNVLTDKRRVILIDRLGYGKSEIGHAFGDINDHIDAYSELLISLNETNETEKPILIGHSYGGPIVVGMAMKLGTAIGGVISIAGTFDPALEKIYSISHLIKYQPLKLLSGPMIWVANDEKIAHAKTLETLTGWSGIKSAIHLYHGTTDSIVPFGNMQYITNKLSDRNVQSFVLTGLDHPLQFTNPELFGNAITNLKYSLIQLPN